MAEQVSDEVLSALSTYPQNPEAGIQQVQPLATEDNLLARALLAWMLGQQGRAPEGLEHALAAAEAGAGQLAMTYAQNLVGQADPVTRDRAGEFFLLAQRFPATFDPFAQAQQALQQGNQQVARDLLAGAFTSPATMVPEEADRMLRDAQQRLKGLSDAETQVEGEATRVRQAMQEALDGIKREEGDLRTVAQQVGALASGSSAILQAQQYSDRADRVERRGELLTRLSLGLALVIAAAAIVLGASAAGESNVGAVARRAALSLPLVFVNVYLARLAGSYRNEALRWRHIELQLKSVVPYLGGLGADLRADVLAALAAGFFPGQGLPGNDHDAAPADLSSVMTAALERTAPRSKPAPGGPGDAQP